MSNILVSPGVAENEIDATNVIPATATTVGGYAGSFNWGPVGKIVTVTSEQDIVSNFSEPTDAVGVSWFTAASFLNYGSNLSLVRVLGGTVNSTTSMNATSGQTGNFGLLITNSDSYYTSFSSGGSNAGDFGAKYPGALGNALSVVVCPASSTAFNSSGFASYAGFFSAAPTTSASAASSSSTNDEFHIVVVDATGAFTGTAGQVLETFPFVSQAKDAVGSDGTSIYYVNVLNRQSKYIWWLNHDTTHFPQAGSAVTTGTAVAFTTGTAVISYTLQGGTDVATTTGGIENAQVVFADPGTVTVQLLFSEPDTSGSTVAQNLVSIVNKRQNSLGLISPPISLTVAASGQLAALQSWGSGIPSTSYAVMDTTAIRVYDKYNDVYRWIPAAGHVAGLCAATPYPWFSPAGLNRGNLLNVVKLAYNPSQADRDALYLSRFNPIVSFPGEGPVLFGDQTALAKPSAFQEIGIRRLFNTLKDSIGLAARYQLFEFNDEFTQAMFRNMTEPYLRDVEGQRGIIDSAVICDSTNNTVQVVNSRQFVGSIYVQPNHSINFIVLNFIATRTGVSFTELTGQQLP